jgi:hypothetical protein
MKRLVLLIIFGFSLIDGYSQIWRSRRYEVWGAVSVLQYYGDIGGTADKNNLMGLKDISLKSNRPGIAVGGIYRYNDRWYFQASNTLGFLAQTDKGSRNAARNFAFSTVIDELSVQAMYFFIREDDKSYSFSILNASSWHRKMNQPLSFYGLAGVGGIFFHVSPKNSFIGSDRFVRKSASLSIPIGVGGKFSLTPEYAFAMELIARYTFSDYLDGLNPPTSKFKDIYYQINFKFIYRIPKSKRSSNPFLLHRF